MTTRREVLKAFAAAGAIVPIPHPMRAMVGAENPDVGVRLVAAPAEVTLRGQTRTRVLRYSGEVIRGRRDALRPSPGNLGPTLELRRGERVRIEVMNRLGQPTVVHWHGMIVPDSADGHPHQAVPSGSGYAVEFTVRNKAGTYLYHPHPDRITGRQTYYGLAGLVIVRDAREEVVGLPADEIELVLQDRRIAGDGELVFKRNMMDDMNGVLGDRVLVNGVDDAAFKVAPHAYRLRVANVSNARIYKLAWSDARPMRVIGSDGGLFSRSEGIQERSYVTLFPFQRVELLEDFGARADVEVALVSREFSGLDMMGSMMGGGMMGRGMMGGGMMGGGMMGGGMMGGGMMRGMMGSAQGDHIHIARFTVAAGARTRSTPIELPLSEPPVLEGTHELHTQLSFRMMRGFLNGRSFDRRDAMAVAEDERLPAGRTSIWTFANDGGGMAMPHPMHVHGVQFRILERRGGDIPDDLREGLIDTGWHDTFGIFPGERVRIALAPEIAGLFMYHCHNLEHEDGGMMRNCRFEA